MGHGAVFARPRADLPLGEGRNVRLAACRLVSEIRRLTLTPPGRAALCGTRGDGVAVGNRARLLGGTGGAIVYQPSTGSPQLLSGSEVSGSPATAAVPGYDGTIQGVFGVPLGDLMSLADVSTDDAAVLPSPLGDYTLTIVDGDCTFGEARPLRGTGILVVTGNCTLESGGNAFFNGLLWVGGRLTMRAPAYLRGTIIVGTGADLRGLGGDYVEVDHDVQILGELLSLLGQYRLCRAAYDPAGDLDLATRGVN